MLEVFKQVQVNITILDMIQQVSSYVKFLKDLCTNKRKFRPNERIQLNPSVSALFKPHLPVKCQDPGSFTVPCTIGNMTITNALLDLGAAINVMPSAIFTSLGITGLKNTSVVLQLADHTL